jgi:hypothetical protein
LRRVAVQENTMSIVSRALVLSVAFALLAAPASAAITDPEMSCAQYLKTGASRAHKAASAAKPDPAIDAKLRAFCAANPKMTAMDAEIAVMGD